jgi:hypothetical protein
VEWTPQLHVADSNAVKPVISSLAESALLASYSDQSLLVEQVATDDDQPKRSATTTECGRSLARRSPSSASATDFFAMAAHRALRKIRFGYHNRVKRIPQQFSGVF